MMEVIQTILDFIQDDYSYRPVICFILTAYIVTIILFFKRAFKQSDCQSIVPEKQQTKPKKRSRKVQPKVYEPYDDGSNSNGSSMLKEPTGQLMGVANSGQPDSPSQQVPDNDRINHREIPPQEQDTIITHSDRKVVTPPIQPEPEEQSKIKYIGYDPVKDFIQVGPSNFPYVLMPEPHCVIKFPRKGRTGRKGYTELNFQTYIDKYFRANYQVFNDRFILVKNSTRPFEPDFTLINERNGINIFLDIEIDEPYEGTNDIKNRRATHYQNSDYNRNLSLTRRGWIVIRFAEIQVHRQPDSCCKLIAEVLSAVDASYCIAGAITECDELLKVPQWTKEEAEQWSLNKYRELYLGIDRFGLTTNGIELNFIEETALGTEIEKEVDDTADLVIKNGQKRIKADNTLLSHKYVTFYVNNEKQLFQPRSGNENEVSGFCYIKNKDVTFQVNQIRNVEVISNYYTFKYENRLSDGITEISKIINKAILESKTIRIKYTKPVQQSVSIDMETGEVIEHVVKPEESERTLSDIALSVNVLPRDHIESYWLDENYVSGYCHSRNELRTFKFKRIGKIEILNM